ncbi:hypothetical protein PSPTOT1_3233 [Pseudomonas syringae pv. tomato T1]|nr:hypothetical protein PSPTOT1_3233 [Pseudomonas syringae pv. tomato T1]QBI64504.1 hypothetical protein EIZ61_25220 [Pseudomonas syringae]TES54717.1 hypothetical protein E2N91_22740 [Pseudomonas syringae pv. tomato]TES68038.1 hypothetical protein E2N90_09850 [Pseudomonas syringae pv. tomato]TES74887.1 hypothetical protein E2N89_23085 [Pseudomonas syringae pv. tomato]
MGCEAALKPVTLVVTDTHCAQVSLPVPGRSRTSPLLQKMEFPAGSQASPGPLLQTMINGYKIFE